MLKKLQYYYKICHLRTQRNLKLTVEPYIVALVKATLVIHNDPRAKYYRADNFKPISNNTKGTERLKFSGLLLLYFEKGALKLIS